MFLWEATSRRARPRSRLANASAGSHCSASRRSATAGWTSPRLTSSSAITPQAHADRLAFLVRVFTRQTINSLMESEHVDSRQRRKRHRLLLLLDEFPKLGSLPFLENAVGEMAGYGLTAHLICQSFNDVFSKYGDRTPLFDNMHITAAFATSEPNSIEKVTRRAGKALEMRESFSDPRSIFGRAHRSTSQSEQQRYILSEEDVRALDDRKQLLFVNNCKPILADKIRYYEEPFFKARTGDYFNGHPATYQQRPGAADLPCEAHNDWKGVRAAGAPPPAFTGVTSPDAAPRIDPSDYVTAQRVHHAHGSYEDDGLA